jgi:hypothetical protein
LVEIVEAVEHNAELFESQVKLDGFFGNPRALP